MRTSKIGLDHVNTHKHLNKSASHGGAPSINLNVVSDNIIKAIDAARNGQLAFSHPVQAPNVKELKHQLAGFKLNPDGSQFFMGLVVRGDLVAAGLKPLSSAFPGGVANLDALEINSYRAILMQQAGKLTLSAIYQADTDEELDVLVASLNLSAHDDAFLGFAAQEL